MPKYKLTGPDATDFLAGQARSRPSRRPRPSNTYPAVFREWITKASVEGAAQLTVPTDAGSPKPSQMVLEIRKYMRACVEELSPMAAICAGVMVLPPEGQTVWIVRRDRGYVKVQVQYHSSPAPPAIGHVPKSVMTAAERQMADALALPDPLAALESQSPTREPLFFEVDREAYAKEIDEILAREKREERERALEAAEDEERRGEIPHEDERDEQDE